MIFYFSATGNSLYVAERIAAATNDNLMPIKGCIEDARFEFSLEPGENLGFVVPTYFWGLPTIVLDFVGKLHIARGANAGTQEGGNQAAGHYVFHVATCGVTPGASIAGMKKALAARGIMLQGGYAVHMVDTWTPIFDVSDAAKNKQKTLGAEPEIDAAIEKIQQHAEQDAGKGSGLLAISGITRGMYNSSRATSNFHVLDACIGCGLCARQCPARAIEIRNGKPVWVKDRCVLCLGCLHRCPKFAIRYGDKTDGHGQFVNPNVKL